MGAGGGVPGFTASGAAYDAFMGRYSNGLATAFAEVLGVREGGTALDVGCGPGALCDVLVARLGSASVSACDPSPGFVAECSARHPGVTVLQGRAEAVPFPDAGFDVVAAQLVFHFVTDPDAAVGELRRVARPGGTVGACVWDGEHGMEMLRDFWGAAAELDAHLPEEARSLRFGRPGELVELFERAGLDPVSESTLDVHTDYAKFDELWSGFEAGIGPAGAYCAGLPAGRRARLRDRLWQRLGRPGGRFTLMATARCVTGSTPT